VNGCNALFFYFFYFKTRLMVNLDKFVNKRHYLRQENQSKRNIENGCPENKIFFKKQT